MARCSSGTTLTSFELLEDILSLASPRSHPDIAVIFRLGVPPSHFSILGGRNADILCFLAQRLKAYGPPLQLLPSLREL